MKKQQNTKTTKAPKRNISGIFLLDKPLNLSSNQALQKVKHAFNAKKAGHTGALDPLATGLLPICLGEATKFSHYLLESTKSYETIIQLGQQTDTGDAEGEVVKTAPIPTLTKDSILTVLQSFMGHQQQIPPMYSALKKEGKKLYELARQGIEVERPARDIEISQLDLIDFTKDSIHISVTCSKGTYIRVLGEDIAKAFNSLGFLAMLRRTQTGCFNIQDAMTIEDLLALENLEQKDANLLPSHSSINHIPRITVDEEQAKRIKMGQRLNVFSQISDTINSEFNQKQSDKIEVLIFLSDELQEQFLGLALLEKTGRLQPKKIIQQ